MLNEECSRLVTVFSFVNSALDICDLGLPVDRSQFCISCTLLRGPWSCPWTVPASVFWTHPTSPSFFPSAWKINSLQQLDVWFPDDKKGWKTKTTSGTVTTFCSCTDSICGSELLHTEISCKWFWTSLTWVYFRKNTPCTLPKIS